jgi:hypothetical protein
MKKLGGTHIQCKIWDGLRCHDIHTNFHKYWFRHSNVIGGVHTDTPSNITVSFEKFDRLQCRFYWRDEFMIYAVEILHAAWYIYTVEVASCGMIYVPSFMEIGTVVQAILRFCLRNCRGCNVGITDGRYFIIMPLRWAQEPWYTIKFHKDLFRHSKVNKGDIQKTDSKVIL